MKITTMKTRLLLLLLPLFFFSFAILSGISYYLSRQALGESVDEAALAVGRDYSHRVEAYLHDGELQLNSFTAIKRIYDPMDRGQLLTALKECEQRLGTLDNITYISIDGSALRPDGSTLFLGDRDYFKQALSTKKPVVSDIILSKTTGKIGVNIGVPVLNNGQVTGVLTGAISLEKLGQLIKEMKFLNSGYGVIGSSTGNTVVHPRQPEAAGKLNFLEKKVNPELKLKEPELDDRIIALYKQALDSGKQVRGAYRFADGVVRIGSFTPIQLAGNQRWIMIVTAPEAEATEKISSLTMAMLLASVLCFLSAILFIVLISRHIAKPIALIRDECRLLAQGDLRGQSSQVSSQDEIGQLTRDFQTMRQNLYNLVRQVLAQAEQLAASSEELTASAHQSAEASNNVAQSIQQVAMGSEKQVGAVNETSAIVEEISATMQEVAATAGEMATLSEQTSKAALDGQTSIDRAVSQMGAVSNGSKQAQAAAEELKASSVQIGEIVNLISTIAGQTNLLALNAAIEAARAGEQGRGFAVVAEEVRKLAEQSEQAAHQIKGLVDKNHGSIGNVVGAIDLAIKDISQGVELVNVAGGNFAAINTQIGHVTEQVSIIASAVNEAAVGSQRIVSSIKEVEILSRDAAAESQNVSAATEEQSASMEEIAASSQSLAKLAEDLQNAVAKFRV